MTLSEIEIKYNTESDPADRMNLITCLLQLEGVDWALVEAFAANVLLADENPIIRHEAAFVLGDLRESGRIGDGLGATALHHAATLDVSPTVRHEAAEAMHCFAGEKIELALHQLLSDPVEDVRLTAAMSLSWRRRVKERAVET